MRNRRKGIRTRKEKKLSKALEILLAITIIIFILIIIIQQAKQKSTEKSIADIMNTLNNMGSQNITNENFTENNNTSNNIESGSNITTNTTPENTTIPNITSNDITNTTTDEPTTTQEKNTTFTMAVTGDIMCHNTMYEDAYNKSKKTYDFTYMFEDIKLHLQTADITVGNLETVFAGSKVGYSSYPTFNTPEILAKNLKKLGFDVLSTANNHCMDKGYSGLVSTLNHLDINDISHTGTYRNKKEQQNILIKNVKGIKIAFLSFTYDTNGISIPKNKSFCVNLADKKTILAQLKLAKAKNPDLICVSMHWGTEYETKPNSKQKELADLLFKNGTDIILGNHPHVAQSMEKRKIKQADGLTKDGFVIYSLGNFMADQDKPNTRSSAILNLQITKNNETGKISIDKASYVPTYIYKKSTGKTKKFKIIDIKNTIAAYDAEADKSIGKSTYNILNNELKNIQKLIGKEILK